MESIMACIGLAFGPDEYEIVLDALMQFQPPDDYDPAKRATLDRLRLDLLKALGKLPD